MCTTVVHTDMHIRVLQLTAGLGLHSVEGCG